MNRKKVYEAIELSKPDVFSRSLISHAGVISKSFSAINMLFYYQFIIYESFLRQLTQRP